MRLGHYMLIVATIAWMAVALVWGVNRFVIDLSFAPIELIYLGAFAISALIGGLVFAEAASLAEQAEFGGILYRSPKRVLEDWRFKFRQKREKIEEDRAKTTTRRRTRKGGLNLRW
jgi:hypothetical protein